MKKTTFLSQGNLSQGNLIQGKKSPIPREEKPNPKGGRPIPKARIPFPIGAQISLPLVKGTQKVGILADCRRRVNLTRKALTGLLGIPILTASLLVGCPSNDPRPSETITRTRNLLLEPGRFEGAHRRILTFLNNEDRYSLTLPATGSVLCSERVELGRRSRLLVELGVLRPAWPLLEAGIAFKVLVRPGVGSGTSSPWTEVFSRLLLPSQNPDQRKWLDVEIDLSRYDQTAVEIRFDTQSEDSLPDTAFLAAFANPSLADELPRPNREDRIRIQRTVLDLVEGRAEGFPGRPPGTPEAILLTDEKSLDSLLALPAPPGTEFSVTHPVRGRGVLEVSGAILNPALDSLGEARFEVRAKLDGTETVLLSRLLGLSRKEIFQESLEVPGNDEGSEREVTLTFDVQVSQKETPPPPSPAEDQPPTGWTQIRLTTDARQTRRRVSRSSPNVLVLVADTLRADHLSAYGYPRKTSPNLDALAAKGRRFELCIANSSWTLPSVASLFTGTPPLSHGVTELDRARLASGYLTLAEAFQDEGYATGGFVANGLVSSYSNFHQGFSRFESLPSRRADVVVGLFCDWLDELHPDEAFFSYVHFIDPHGPYAAPPPYKNRFVPRDYSGKITPEFLDLVRLRFQQEKLENAPAHARQLLTREYAKTAVQENQNFIDRYDGEIAFMDEHIGFLLDELDKRGRLENTVVVFTSDHGEGFYEHGSRGHGKNVYEEVVHVPLILVAPGRVEPGVTSVPAELASVYPTLAGLVDLPVPPSVLAPDLLSSRLGTPPLYTTIDTGRIGTEMNIPMSSVRRDDMKLIRIGEREPTYELYDLARDSGEKNDLYPTRKAEAMTVELVEQLRKWREQTGADRATTSGIDDQTKALAEGMGYTVRPKKTASPEKD